MKKMMKLALAAALGLTIAACAEEKPAEEPPKEEAPAKVEIPPYEPTGDMAEMKKAGAEGVTADNAGDQAKALEEELNKEIQALEAPAAAEGAGAEAAPAQ